MTQGYWYSMAYLDNKKKIETIGIDYGVDPVVVYRKGKYELWKVPGHSCTLPGSIGPEYFPTQFFIVEVKKMDKPRVFKFLGRRMSWSGQTATHECTPVTDEVKPGHKWRTAVDELKAKVIELDSTRGK